MLFLKSFQHHLIVFVNCNRFFSPEFYPAFVFFRIDFSILIIICIASIFALNLVWVYLGCVRPRLEIVWDLFWGIQLGLITSKYMYLNFSVILVYVCIYRTYLCCIFVSVCVSMHKCWNVKVCQKVKSFQYIPKFGAIYILCKVSKIFK